MTEQPTHCPRHPQGFDRSCDDVRCRRMWKPEGAPTRKEQLDRWVAGDAVCPNEFHECTPDFGCCHPKLLWPKEKREKYVAASRGEQEKMMMVALDSFVSEVGANAHVTRGDPADRG